MDGKQEFFLLFSKAKQSLGSSSENWDGGGT
jgi:hypothetical protein